MKNHSRVYPSALVLFVLLVGLACQATAGLAPTATPAATRTPAPTNTPAPTSSPTGEPGPFTISEDLYRHSSGSFSFYPPQGWELTETDFEASFDHPDGDGKVYISATNTGYELDQASFTSFVDASENNYFASGFERYSQLANGYDAASKSVQVYKTLNADGKSWVVDSVYYQVGQAIIEVSFWMVSDTQIDAYIELLNNLNVEEGSVATMIPYVFTYTFLDKNNFFQFDVPIPWASEYAEQDTCYFNTFTSPDGLAAMQNITCDAGQTMNQTAAGQFALDLLNTSYTSGAGDIKIIKDEPLADGSEKLTWTSQKGGYSGVSIFETRGTNVLLLTLFASNEAFSVFDPAFVNALSTYKIP